MIALGSDDLPAIEALLAPARADAMFILSNLRAQGFGGDHPHGMRVWADVATPGALLGLTNSGMVLAYLPQPRSDVADLLRGRPLAGCAGPASMVRPLLTELGLTEAPTGLNDDSPQFLLDLAGLVVPDGPGRLAPVSEEPEIALRWRHAYEAELHPPADPIPGTMPEWITSDRFRFLMIDGRPAAMTGFNATLPEIVQVGGVYTPPETRNRGLARRAVALHLAEARAAGVRQATLFAASETAVACYAPLGFIRCGTFALILFDGKMTP